MMGISESHYTLFSGVVIGITIGAGITCAYMMREHGRTVRDLHYASHEAMKLIAQKAGDQYKFLIESFCPRCLNRYLERMQAVKEEELRDEMH